MTVRPADESPCPHRAVVVLRSLEIGHARGRRLVAPIDAEVRSGELVALVGPNGSGKSTLLRTIAGLDQALGGVLLLDGQPLTGYRPAERARKIGIVLSRPPETGAMRVGDLVALGRYPYTGWMGRLDAKDNEAIGDALRLAAVDRTHLEREVATLSDGERQRVFLARALAQGSEVLLLDEPTSFLDWQGKAEILALLVRLARETEMAVVVATHDLELALRSADRVWLLGADGSFAAGTPTELRDRLQATFPGLG